MTDTSLGFKGEIPTQSSFLLEIDGTQIGMFSEVSGLEVNVEVATYAEGGTNGFTHKLPGRMEWPNIVLKRGITDSDALFSWVNKTAGPGFESNQKKLTRTTGAITVIGTDGSRLRSWNLEGVFAVRWKGPSFNSSNGEALDEELELAHQGFQSKTYSGGS